MYGVDTCCGNNFAVYERGGIVDAGALYVGRTCSQREGERKKILFQKQGLIFSVPFLRSGGAG